MNTTVDTEISTFNARLCIEGALQLEARRLWNDIIAADAEHGTEWTRMILHDEMNKVARKRITSRSTSVISNMLEDLYGSVCMAAYAEVMNTRESRQTMNLRLQDLARRFISNL